MSDKMRVMMNVTVEELDVMEAAVGSVAASDLAIGAYREIRDAQKRLERRIAKAEK